MLKGRNITGIIVATIYCLIMFEILLRSQQDGVVHLPAWYYTIIPIGASIICFIFDKFIKFDFFKEDER